MTDFGARTHVGGPYDEQATTFLSLIAGEVVAQLSLLRDNIQDAAPIDGGFSDDSRAAVDAVDALGPLDIATEMMLRDELTPAGRLLVTAWGWLRDHIRVVQDSTHAVVVLASANPQPILAALPVGRLALEAAAQLRMLLGDPGDRGVDRQGRWIAYWLYNEQRIREVQREPGATAVDDPDPDPQFLDDMENLGFTRVKGTVCHEGAGVRIPIKTNSIEQMRIDLPTDDLVRTWRIASGGAHALPWLAHHELEVVEQGRNPGAQLLAGALMCRVAARVSVEAVGAYYGRDSNAFVELTDQAQQRMTQRVGQAFAAGVWDDLPVPH